MTFDFIFTADHLRQMIGNNPKLTNWYEALCSICPKYGINTKKRLAAFISQCAHESGDFKFLSENFNYGAEGLMKTWPNRFPTLDIARSYQRNPQKIANAVYANRMGNGDAASGDGWRYIGRGLIQLTGKQNYQRFASSVKMEIEQVPEYLGTFKGAVESACFFWSMNSLNVEADAGDIKMMTKKINGGFHGLDDRTQRYNKAIKILSA